MSHIRSHTVISIDKLYRSKKSQRGWSPIKSSNKSTKKNNKKVSTNAVASNSTNSHKKELSKRQADSMVTIFRCPICMKKMDRVKAASHLYIFHPFWLRLEGSSGKEVLVPQPIYLNWDSGVPLLICPLCNKKIPTASYLDHLIILHPGLINPDKSSITKKVQTFLNRIRMHGQQSDSQAPMNRKVEHNDKTEERAIDGKDSSTEKAVPDFTNDRNTGKLISQTIECKEKSKTTKSTRDTRAKYLSAPLPKKRRKKLKFINSGYSQDQDSDSNLETRMIDLYGELL